MEGKQSSGRSLVELGLELALLAFLEEVLLCVLILFVDRDIKNVNLVMNLIVDILLFLLKPLLMESSLRYLLQLRLQCAVFLSDLINDLQ